MLKKIYIDNFRAFVNFEATFEASTLLAGRNGSGKTSVFDVLEKVRALIVGDGSVSTLFPVESLTSWESRREQRFELEVHRGDTDELYRYTLVIEQDPEKNRARILREELRVRKEDQEGPLFAFREGAVQLYKDDHKPGKDFPFDWNRSGLGFLVEASVNKRLYWFRRWVEKILLVRLNPASMLDRADTEVARPAGDFRDFAGWLRHLYQQSPRFIKGLFEDLGKTLDGFVDLSLRGEEDVRVLRVFFSPESGGKEYSLRFGQLSDGQRAVICLYALIHATQVAPLPAWTLLLDEPDNFLALAEIQPLFHRFCDLAEEGRAQAIFISHHPELIDHIGIATRLLFYREKGSPARTADLESERVAGLTLAETLARGWEEHG